MVSSLEACERHDDGGAMQHMWYGEMKCATCYYYGTTCHTWVSKQLLPNSPTVVTVYWFGGATILVSGSVSLSNVVVKPSFLLLSAATGWCWWVVVVVVGLSSSFEEFQIELQVAVVVHCCRSKGSATKIGGLLPKKGLLTTTTANKPRSTGSSTGNSSGIAIMVVVTKLLTTQRKTWRRETCCFVVAGNKTTTQGVLMDEVNYFVLLPLLAACVQ